MVQLLQMNGHFTGLPHEDLQVYIQNFLEINDTYPPTGVLSFGKDSYGKKRNRGQVLEKIYDELHTLLNRISQGNTEWNRGNSKPVNAISTHSGWQLIELTPQPKLDELKGKGKVGEKGESNRQKEDEESKMKPPPPFRQKFKKKKKEECFEKFINMLKQVQINLPLIDVLQGIPKNAKYTKVIMDKKNKLAEYEIVALTEEYNSRILNKIKLPTKQKDPRIFMVQKLGFGNPTPTIILLQLADSSVARPDGIIEDVLVQVGSLIFPMDFVILPPFLATRVAFIDVAAGRLTIKDHIKVQVFDVYNVLKLPAIYEELSAIIVIDEVVAKKCVESKNPMESVLMGQDREGDVLAQEIVNMLDTHNMSMWKK
ncbi:uncharacterized protein LOC129893022 [Solanum dulcamara]|uniref:uncharacterized protein LOC129893022 n=1 Tax=Solanum dulcamara TaxID=45834 RepID=UPI002484DFE8|nr:uncharacterized protein LOC129893022 [Solanum dulcamara]